MPKGHPKNGINKGWFKKGSIVWNKGKKGVQKVSQETRLKLSKIHKGYKFSPEVVEKIRQKNLGKKRSLEARLKMRLAKKGKYNGENNPFWKGGISFEPYTIDWTNSLKISIRERDKYICQLCGEKQGDRAHSIHHINYDKKNCDPKNLITLCMKCHMKTNTDREYWINYFNLLLL